MFMSKYHSQSAPKKSPSHEQTITCGDTRKTISNTRTDQSQSNVRNGSHRMQWKRTQYKSIMALWSIDFHTIILRRSPPSLSPTSRIRYEMNWYFCTKVLDMATQTLNDTRANREHYRFVRNGRVELAKTMNDDDEEEAKGINWNCDG